MSDLIAFHGSSALKKQCIGRIEKYRDARSFNPFIHVAWMPEHSMCTPLGALLESADIEKFEPATGLPVQLALLYQVLLGVSVVSIPHERSGDGAFSSAPPVFVLPDAIAGHWTAWLEAIEPGSCVPDLFAAVLAWILRDLLSADHPVAPLLSDVRMQISAVGQLFEAEAAGHAVTTQQWAAVRKTCVEMTDALAIDDAQSGFVKPITQFLESVCWPWMGDYTEPLQSLRALASAITQTLATRLSSAKDLEVAAGQERAMAEYMTQAQADPKFDPQAFFKQSKELTAYWSFEFQQVLANQQLQTTPLIGGRMLAGLVECIGNAQSNGV